MASLLFRLKVTVAPSACTEPSIENSGAGPSLSAIFSIRSKENFTSSAVILRPLEKLMSSRSTQRYVWSFCPTNVQLFAASGTGVVLPCLKVSSDW